MKNLNTHATTYESVAAHLMLLALTHEQDHTVSERDVRHEIECVRQQLSGLVQVDDHLFEPGNEQLESDCCSFV